MRIRKELTVNDDRRNIVTDSRHKAPGHILIAGGNGYITVVMLRLSFWVRTKKVINL